MLGIYSCNGSHQLTFEISGKIENPSGHTLELLVDPADLVSNFSQAIPVVLDEEGHCNVSFIIDKPVVGQLSWGNNRVQVFLEPGMNVQVFADGDDFISTITFLGQGAVENSFIWQYNREFPESGNFIPSRSYAIW